MLTLGDILKGTVKVVGSAGLLIVAGLAEAATDIAEKNGDDPTAFGELCHASLKQIDKIWGKETDEEADENAARKRKLESFDTRCRNITKLLRQAESEKNKAEKEGNTDLCNNLEEKIKEYKDKLDEISQERFEFVNNDFDPELWQFSNTDSVDTE